MFLEICVYMMISNLNFNTHISSFLGFMMDRSTTTSDFRLVNMGVDSFKSPIQNRSIVDAGQPRSLNLF